MRFAGSAAMASGMAGSAAADALMPNNCFVAGTPVWVLRDGVDAQTANAALAEGASWEEFAEQKPIEEVEAGDYALSRPEDDADGQLRFMPVRETYTNTTEEVVELWVVNYATGEHDHLTTTPGHPFWTATSSGSTASGGPERQSAGRDGGWEFAVNLEPGDTLTNADGEPLTVTATAHKARHEATYNFCVAFDHTYYVGNTTGWVHNASIRHNKFVGTMFELAQRARIESEVGRSSHAEQVRIRPFGPDGKPANYYFIADSLVERDGQLVIEEHKSSATARLTRNQSRGFKAVGRYGGVVEGHTAGSMAPKGTVIEPHAPKVNRPKPKPPTGCR